MDSPSKPPALIYVPSVPKTTGHLKQTSPHIHHVEPAVTFHSKEISRYFFTDMATQALPADGLIPHQLLIPHAHFRALPSYDNDPIFRKHFPYPSTKHDVIPQVLPHSFYKTCNQIPDYRAITNTDWLAHAHTQFLAAASLYVPGSRVPLSIHGIRERLDIRPLNSQISELPRDASPKQNQINPLEAADETIIKTEKDDDPNYRNCNSYSMNKDTEIKSGVAAEESSKDSGQENDPLMEQCQNRIKVEPQEDLCNENLVDENINSSVKEELKNDQVFFSRETFPSQLNIQRIENKNFALERSKTDHCPININEQLTPSDGTRYPGVLKTSRSDQQGQGKLNEGQSSGGEEVKPKKRYSYQYRCNDCGKVFSRSNTLVTHQRIHTGDKPFVCEDCGRAFRQPGNLTRHRLTHTTAKPHMCPQCNKGFKRASNLQTHMRTHSSSKPFQCDFCGKGFNQKIDMKVHRYIHTGEKPHRCQKCGRGFKQLTHLTYHMRTHSDIRMYHCQFCGKGFNQKGNLQAHIYGHTGERPFKCDVCGKGFTLTSTLNTHKRIHAPRKPFQCQFCDKAFYQKNALRTHYIATHPYVNGTSLL